MELSRRDFLRGVAAGALGAAILPSWADSDQPALPPEKPSAKLPPLPRRGIHVMSAGAAGMPALQRLIGEIAPGLGLNWVILEVGAGFQYQSHPEAADPDSITKAEARKLAALARDNGIQLVPEYNSLGHQSWRPNLGALLKAHLEFNETPDLDPGFYGVYCLSWCPNHPEINALVFDLYDELIDAFEAKAFHVGMDEVFILGECARCKGTPNDELFAKAVNDCHQHLVGKRGVEMEMWGDRLLNAETTGYGKFEASENSTWGAIDKVPKDIVICDWHYGMDNPEFPSIRLFQEKGFRVWPSGWNNERSIRRMIEVARQESGPLMLGYLATTWTEVDPLVKGLAGEPVESPPRRFDRIVAGVKLGAELAKG